MKLLDKYIIKKFIGTFLFLVMILSVIVVVIDISQKVDLINENGSTLGEALTQYYPYWVVWLVNTFVPVAVFISAIYFTSRITNNTEIVAMHAGGVSFYRLAKSYLMAGLIIAILVLVINHFILPMSNIRKNKYDYTYLLNSNQKNDYYGQRSIAAQISDSSYVFINSYDRRSKTGSGFLYQVFDSTGLRKSISANNVSWEEKDSVFILEQFFERTVTGGSDIIKDGPEKRVKLNLTPEQLLPEGYVAETMNSVELKKFIEREKFKGSANTNVYLMEYHRRTSIAITVLILIMLAVALSSKKVRGGIGLNLALGIAMAFIYIFIVESARIFSAKGVMPPFLAAWMGNIIFGIITLFFLYKRAKS